MLTPSPTQAMVYIVIVNANILAESGKQGSRSNRDACRGVSLHKQ